MMFLTANSKISTHLLPVRTSCLGKEQKSHWVLDTPNRRHALVAFPSHPWDPGKWDKRSAGRMDKCIKVKKAPKLCSKNLRIGPGLLSA